MRGASTGRDMSLGAGPLAFSCRAGRVQSAARERHSAVLSMHPYCRQTREAVRWGCRGVAVGVQCGCSGVAREGYTALPSMHWYCRQAGGGGVDRVAVGCAEQPGRVNVLCCPCTGTADRQGGWTRGAVGLQWGCVGCEEQPRGGAAECVLNRNIEVHVDKQQIEGRTGVDSMG